MLMRAEFGRSLCCRVKTYHVYYSEHNRGAREIILETIATAPELSTLKYTSSPSEMADCDGFVVYLNEWTWSSGEQSELFAGEVRISIQPSGQTPWPLLAACAILTVKLL